MTGGLPSCRRCLFDASVPNITFDEEGICLFCRLLEQMRARPPALDAAALAARIRRRMKGRAFDCIVPLSGGMDSTYVLYAAKKSGLRPVAVHTDNGWVSPVSRRNMKAATEMLGVPLVVLSKPWDLLKEVYTAFLKASVPEICSACEVKSISEIMGFADRAGIPFLLWGFSPETDGLAPLRWHYVDGRYYDSVVSRFCRRPEEALRLNRYRAKDLFYYGFVRGIRHVMYPRHASWEESRIKRTLRDELGWTDEGHHSDCLFFPVMKSILKTKFGIDKEKTFLAAQINAGVLTRTEARERLARSQSTDVSESWELVRSRLGLTPRELEGWMSRPPRDFTAFPTYYPAVKRLKPVLRLGCRAGIVPHGLYEYFFRTAGEGGPERR